MLLKRYRHRPAIIARKPDGLTIARKPGGLMLALFLGALATGCAGLEGRLSESRQMDTADPGVRACFEKFEKFDQATMQVTDGAAARIPGFPYLRINRFLASFTKNSLKGQAFDAWLGRLRNFDRQARRIEYANLPARARSQLTVTPAQLERCAKRLIAHDFKQKNVREILFQSARVPDAYHRWAQVAGLYPLSVIPVRFGVMHLQDSQRDDFKRISSPKTLRVYAPKSHRPYDPNAVRVIFQKTKRDALGIPAFDDSALDKLFAMFAPVIEAETESADDNPGRVLYDAKGTVRIDAQNPVLYRRLAFTRFKGHVLAQLVYTVWFPARTSSGPFDIFAGKLDGLIWRVTFDQSGRPMAYDAIHPCGCYHLFFPVSPWKIADADQHGFHAEPPLAPITGPALQAGQRIHLRLKAATHYLAGVTAKRAATIPKQHYRLADANALRSLAHPPSRPMGRKSLYAPDGLIDESARPERFLLWPMGVPSAGAMRQWGHHATAFIGTRHFDDADLFERVLAREN